MDNGCKDKKNVRLRRTKSQKCSSETNILSKSLKIAVYKPQELPKIAVYKPQFKKKCFLTP